MYDWERERERKGTKTPFFLSNKRGDHVGKKERIEFSISNSETLLLLNNNKQNKMQHTVVFVSTGIKDTQTKTARREMVGNWVASSWINPTFKQMPFTREKSHDARWSFPLSPSLSLFHLELPLSSPLSSRMWREREREQVPSPPPPRYLHLPLSHRPVISRIHSSWMNNKVYCNWSNCLINSSVTRDSCSETHAFVPPSLFVGESSSSWTFILCCWPFG